MPSTATLRHADPDTARRYPLPVQEGVQWYQDGGRWRVTLPLPDLDSGTILVPSFAWSSAASGTPARSVGQPDRYQWTLTAAGGRWPLQEVPGRSAVPRAEAGSPVSTHVDCFHVHRPLRSAELHLSLRAPHAPAHYLICVSSRALTIAEPPLPPRASALARPPVPRSQMTAPPAIAPRICSPTCVSMVLDLWGIEHDWLALARECFDPITDMYGIWPVALAAAARRNCLGAVEVFDRWEEPLLALERGIPLVASIRFSAGELPGAPLAETGGHLVLVYGVSPQTIRVCDPAAPQPEVDRRYPAEAFTRAWLRHRGAAYILPP